MSVLPGDDLIITAEKEQVNTFGDDFSDLIMGKGFKVFVHGMVFLHSPQR